MFESWMERENCRQLAAELARIARESGDEVAASTVFQLEDADVKEITSEKILGWHRAFREGKLPLRARRAEYATDGWRFKKVEPDDKPRDEVIPIKWTTEDKPLAAHDKLTQRSKMADAALAWAMLPLTKTADGEAYEVERPQ
jgi:hypothetical protein